jgi:endonuclease-3
MKPDPQKNRVRRIVRRLAQLYSEAPCALVFADPLQLLIATILSAQCTDVRVNKVTPALFARFPDAAALADADRAELERLIQSTGFFRNKAHNIQLCCRAIVEKHGGQVPSTMEELTSLPGVGRKTANVVLGTAFGMAALPVDTHVSRLSRRMGLTVHTDPVKIERDLMERIPKKEWTMFSHRMIYHGRQVCHARTPHCDECGLAKMCPRNGV